MIEILKLEMINKGSLIARFNVKMHKWGGFVIRDCTLFDSAGKTWVTFPSKQYEADGKKKYFPYVAFENHETDKKFREVILKEVNDYLEKMKISKPASQSNNNEEELPF
jgi:hypothetical protein